MTILKAVPGVGAATPSGALAPMPPAGRRRRGDAAAARSPASMARASAPSASRSIEPKHHHSEEEDEEEQEQSGGTERKTFLLSHAAPLAAGAMAARLAVVTARLLGRALFGATATPTTAPAPPKRRRLASRVSSTLRPDLLPAGHEPKPPSRSPSGASAPAIVWFRADLRTRDHAPLRAALASARVTSVLPVFVFDAREYPSLQGSSGNCSSSNSNSTTTNVPTAGPRRAALVCGAVRELRARLRALGSDLLVRVGAPEEVLPRLAAASGAARVYCHREGGAHDAGVERAVASALWSRAGGCELRCGSSSSSGKGGAGWGAAGALLHPSDLPAALRPPAAPTGAKAASRPAPTTAFGDFCQRVTGVRVREPLAAPLRLKGLPTPLPAVAGGAGGAATAAAAATTLEAGPIPSMRELGFADDAASSGSGGGETEALRQLRAFAQDLRRSQRRQGGAAHSLSSSSSSSAAAAAADATAAASAFAARISPWLAVGCLSPREVFAELSAKDSGGKAKGAVIAPPARLQQQQKRPAGAKEDDERAWLASELLLRDFFGMLNAWRNSSPGPVAAKSAAPAGAVAAAAAACPQLAFA